MKKKSCAHAQSTHSVVMASGGTEELERPASFKSPVWEHFGFPVKYNDEEKRLVDKTVTVCRHCGTRKPYDSGNTSSMATQATSPRCFTDRSENKGCSTTAYHSGI